MEGKELCIEVGLKGHAIHRTVYPISMSEYTECVGQNMASLHVKKQLNDLECIRDEGITSKLDVGEHVWQWRH